MPLTRASAYARRSENYSIDKRVGLGLWALPLPPNPLGMHMPMFDLQDENDDSSDDNDDDTNCSKASEESIGIQSFFWGEKDPCSPESPPSSLPPDPSPPPPFPPTHDDDDDEEDCTKRSPLNEFMSFWGEKDPCAPESPPSPPPPDPSPPLPSLPRADGIAELLEDEISDADSVHHVEQRPSFYEAYESEAQLEEAQLESDVLAALWPSKALQAPIHSPPPPLLLLTDHVGELLKDEILGAGKQSNR